MKKSIITASLLLSGAAAFAQAPPPVAPQQSEPVPITLDVATQTAIVQFLQKAPYEFASPVIDTIRRLQEEAQRKAVTDRVRAMTTKPAEAK